MPNDDPGSVTNHIEAMRRGDHDAARELWERYFERLVRLARARFPAFHKAGSINDEEDAALSAFGKILVGLPRGEFAGVTNRDKLWRILVCVTERTAINHREWRDAIKRGDGDLIYISELQRTSDREEADQFAEFPGSDPTPEFLTLMEEQKVLLMHQLKLNDPEDKKQLVRIATLLLDGHTKTEIAKTLRWSGRTIWNRIHLILKIWGRAL